MDDRTREQGLCVCGTVYGDAVHAWQCPSPGIHVLVPWGHCCGSANCRPDLFTVFNTT